MIVAIPRMGEMVAPCFEYSATMSVFVIREQRIVDQKDISLQSRDPFDRVRLLRDQNVNTLICGGMQDVYEDMVRASGLEVISWVYGSVEDLLDMYIRGRLVTRAELRDESGPDRHGSGPIRED